MTISYDSIIHDEDEEHIRLDKATITTVRLLLFALSEEHGGSNLLGTLRHWAGGTDAELEQVRLFFAYYPEALGYWVRDNRVIASFTLE